MRRVPDPAPLTPAERAHLGGLTTLARHGTAHLATIGMVGQDGLSRRIAAEWGIPEDAPDYAARITAARRAYFTRLRRSRAKG
jgi:hypothetical protein